MTLIDKLAAIQSRLHAPKNQKNTFGGYNYRSCEDILEAVKPLLDGLVLTITDEVTDVGGRIYVKATARLTDGKDAMTATAFAREAESRKGMDESQITGSTSSYARKYALNGLFLIDDNKDADSHDNSEQGQKAKPAKQAEKPRPLDVLAAVKAISNAPSLGNAKGFRDNALARAESDTQRDLINEAFDAYEKAALASA